MLITRQSMRATCIGALAVVVLTPGCIGTITKAGDGERSDPPGGSGGQDPSGNDVDPGDVDPGANEPSVDRPSFDVVPLLPLQRLSRREYDNTIRDLLGDTTSQASTFPADLAGDTGYESPGAVGGVETDAYMTAAEKIAASAVTRLASLMPCMPRSAAEEVPCIGQFIRSFGKRAFRRPVADAEATDLLVLFKQARQTIGLSFEQSVGGVIQGILQSPNFLYHRELGSETPVVSGDDVQLTGYELASRLSYFLTGSMPDDDLLQAAGEGRLLDDTGLAEQARRLASSPLVMGNTLTDFTRQWLHLDTSHLEKSAAIYPMFAAVKPTLLEETRLFLTHMVKENLPVEALLTDTTVFVNKATAPLYGLSGPSSNELQRMNADPTRRAGIFTQVPFLTIHASPGGSHPMKRAHMLFEQALCAIAPPPPDDIPAVGEPNPDQTTRERFEQHSTAVCAGCHRMMDPLGFALESFDGIGQFRTEEGGNTIDTSGTLDLPSGKNVVFQNAVDLMKGLAEAGDVTSCVTRQLARYGTHITDGPDEQVARDVLEAVGSEAKLADLVVALTTTKSFRWRKLAPGEEL